MRLRPEGQPARRAAAAHPLRRLLNDSKTTTARVPDRLAASVPGCSARRAAADAGDATALP